MTPIIKEISPIHLVGQGKTTSLAQFQVSELWKNWMPIFKKLNNKHNTYYSISVYPDDFFSAFNPEKAFEKWAAIETDASDLTQYDLQQFTIPGGLYAVFIHKGNTNEFLKTSTYIYYTWLPSSEFMLDDRPHFEILGEKYKMNDPESEEEVWIPIKRK